MDEVEQRTGLDFFSDLEDPDEARLESACPTFPAALRAKPL